MAECKACKAQIIWRKTLAGEWMPLDVQPLLFEPNPNGKDILFDLHAEPIRCDIVEKESGTTRRAWRSHWATCPFADSFRKKKGASKC